MRGSEDSILCCMGEPGDQGSGRTSSEKGVAGTDAADDITEATPGPVTSPEKVWAAVAIINKDTRDEHALGDAARQTRNIAVSNAAWELRSLAIECPENAKLAVEAGGLSGMVRALRQRPNSEAVQGKATSALGYLVLDNHEYQTWAGEAGGIEAVISAMRAHPNSVSVLELAVEALGRLVAQEHYENQMLARLAGGIEAVIIALTQHPDYEPLQINASNALGLLVARNSESQFHAGRARGLQAVIASAKSHSRSEAVLEHTSQALGRLVAHNHDNQRLARELGAIPIMLGVNRRHRKSERVQVCSLYALMEAVADNVENQNLAGEACVAAIIAALIGHEESEHVQAQGCETLGHLVANHQVNQNLAREAGVTQAVIQTAQEHPQSAGVQAKVSLALGSLVAGNAESQKLAGEAGGVEVVTAGLRHHLDSEAVSEHACRALAALVSGIRENQSLAKKASAIETVIQVLRQHPDKANVQMKALLALRNLVIGNHSNTKVAVGMGGIDEVVAALRQYTETDASRPNSCPGSRSGSSSSSRAYQKQAREAGLMEAIISTLRQPPEKKRDKMKVVMNKLNVLPLTRLLHALRDLVAGNYENQRLAAEAGGVEVVLSVLRSEQASEVIEEHAALAFCGMVGENAANQRRAKKAQADVALREGKNAHPENASVQEATEQALEAMYSGETFSDWIHTTDYGKRHSRLTAITDTAMRGVTLEQLLELQDFIQKTLRKHDLVEESRDGSPGRRSVTWEELSMYHVRDHFILPLTRENRCSFVEVVAPGKQPPMWMISHWWGTPFPFTIRMLQLQSRSRHLHGTSAVTYWCCAFANNQRNCAELDEVDVLRSPFARAMLSSSCMGTVLLCDTEVTPLLRTWCVFEAHVTQLLRCGALADRTDKKRYFLDILAPVVHKDPANNERDKVTITMLQDAVGGSWNEVSDTEGVFFPLGVAKLGVQMDVRTAQTSLESDRAAILNFLADGKASKEPPPSVHPKYDELNAFVHNIFASAELYRVASEQPEGSVEAASKLLQLRADVNSFVRQGNTPLFAAAGADPASPAATDADAQLHLIELLVTARADVNRANADVKTVLDCSCGLSEDARRLLLQHGAKTFADAAPDLEHRANAQLTQILASGFCSEQQAFVGGDAGTKLSGAAQRSLQVAATAVLKLYHWAPCRIIIQTGRRHQAQLASERATNVTLALESAGATNHFDNQYMNQRPVLSLNLTIAPATLPSLHRASPAASGAEVSGGTAWHPVFPRSPKAVLSLRSGSDRLPPVCSGDSRVQASRSSARQVAHRALTSFSDAAVPFIDLKDSVNSEFDVLMGSGWPKLESGAGAERGTDGRPQTRQSHRQVGLSGGRALAWTQQAAFSPNTTQESTGSSSSTGRRVPTAAGNSRSFQRAFTFSNGTAKGSKSPKMADLSGSQTPASGGSTPHGPPADLDTLAGDRWFQTSISVSLSTPALLESSSSTGGRRLHGEMARGSSGSSRRPGPGGDRFQTASSALSEGAAVNGTSGVSSRPGVQGLQLSDVESGNRSSVDFAPRKWNSPSNGQVANGIGASNETEDGRPPTRCGRRPVQPKQVRGASDSASLARHASPPPWDSCQPSEMASDELSFVRVASLPSLQRSNNARTFRVTDLME